MKTKKLGHFANVITGFPFKGEKYKNDGVRVVRGENVTEGALRWDMIKCWEEAFDQSQTYSLNQDDIVIGMDGSKVGKNIARIKSSDLPLFLAQRVACVRAKKENDQGFLYYNLYNPRFINYVFKTQTGSSVPHISKKQIEDFEVPDIDFSTQSQISKVLSNLDAKIELNNRINTELEAMAKLIYDYWFVQFEFPNEDGKPYKSSGGNMVWNEELKRAVPEGWEVIPLSEIVLCNKWPLTKSTLIESIKYLDTSSLTQNKIDTIQLINPILDKVPSRAQRIISENDILFSTVRPNQCHFGIIKKKLNNLIASSGFAQIRTIDKKVSNDLLYYFLTSERTINRLQQIAETAVSAYPSISHNDILALKICIPKNRTLLNEINTSLDSINSKMTNSFEENNKLSSLRDWLLPMLMNGQVKVEKQGEYKMNEKMSMAADAKVKYE